MKKKLLVSFSGGETSAYMSQYLWKHKQDEYEMLFVFANTGQENEETLNFVYNFSKLHGFPVVWVEALPQEPGVGTKHTVTSFLKADRDGKVFESIIKKYGIPNAAAPHCTRELKQSPIKSYAKSIGWKDYYLALGIRFDELRRVNKNAEKLRIIYPLVNDVPMTKNKINFWFSQQPFRLNLKGYQGNCITCWKKSDKKLFKIYHENPRNFLFFNKMEMSYGTFMPEARIELVESREQLIQEVFPITFFRGNRSAVDIEREALKLGDQDVIDDSQSIDASCEAYTECHDKEEEYQQVFNSL